MPIDRLLSHFDQPRSKSGSGLSNLLSAPESRGALGGAASGALVSLLMNKKARKKLKKSAKKVGGTAALAGIGYFAYQKWQNSRPANDGGRMAVDAAASPPPLPLPSDLEAAAREVKVSECLRMNIVLTMIAAANADGEIDDDELNRLDEAIACSSIDSADKTRLSRALNDPPTVEEIAGLAFSPMEACELYGAALTAIQVDTPAEKLFLRRLARALELDEDLIETIQATVTA